MDSTSPVFLNAQKHFLSSNSMTKFSDMTALMELLTNCAENQLLFLNMTFGDEDVKKYPVKLTHQKSFLKQIINNLENVGSEIIDEIYSTYCSLLEQDVSSRQVKKFQYHHFRIMLPCSSMNQKIILKSDDNFLSGGTTGLSLWQAGFTLAEWCLENRQHIVKKTVLELGSGSGFTGLVVAAACEPNKVFLTDGHSKVVDQLKENVIFNALDTKIISPQQIRATLNETEISVMKLEWENVNTAALNTIPDLILAADVVYDPSVFNALKKTLLYFLTQKADMFAVMACTLRNKDTLVDFFKVLGTNVKIEEEKLPSEKYFVYNNEFPVIIYKLRHNKVAL